MRFRPCIDIHNGQVVQIVGSSLNDSGNTAESNFSSDKGAAYYAGLYKQNNLPGGHVIILNGVDSEYYAASRQEAVNALSAYPEGLQIGGSVNADNAKQYIDYGASHVIVTSYVFSKGMINRDNLDRLVKAVGKNRIVLDVSCRVRDDRYYVATDRWQVISDTEFNKDLLEMLSGYCDEFLVHAVDVEGRKCGINGHIAGILKESPIPVTYAGGIAEYEDIKTLKETGGGKIDFTIGTALDIFGGKLELSEVIECIR